MAISRLHRHSTDEPDDVQDVLDADDIAAELLGDADEPPTTALPRRGIARPSSDIRTRKEADTRSEIRTRAPSTQPPPSAAAFQKLSARLEETEAELTRLRRHMRARDAYLAELEQALLASTTKLQASGISSIEDAHKLFGRVRGQAFRIAELESELRNMEQRLARLARLLPSGFAE